MVLTMLSLPEFEELCSTRLEHAQWLITVLRENIEESSNPDTGYAQSYDKSIADLENVLTQLTRVKIDMESASIRLSKELTNDKN